MGRDQYHRVGAKTECILEVHTEAPTTDKAVKNVILQYCCWHESKINGTYFTRNCHQFPICAVKLATPALLGIGRRRHTTV